MKVLKDSGSVKDKGLTITGSGIVLQSILFSALDTYFIAPLCILKSILGSLYGFPPSPLFSQTTYNIGIGIPILCKGQVSYLLYVLSSRFMKREEEKISPRHDAVRVCINLHKELFAEEG